MLGTCSHFFKILRNKNPHFAFDAPHPSLSSFDLWFPISCEGRAPCLRFPERGRWNVYLYFDFQTWKLLKAVWEENTTTAFAWKPVVWQHSLCIQNQTVTKVGKKIRTEIETPFYPKRQPFNIIRLFCSNWVAMLAATVGCERNWKKASMKLPTVLQYVEIECFLNFVFLPVLSQMWLY